MFGMMSLEMCVFCFCNLNAFGNMGNFIWQTKTKYRVSDCSLEAMMRHTYCFLVIYSFQNDNDEFNARIVSSLYVSINYMDYIQM